MILPWMVYGLVVAALVTAAAHALAHAGRAAGLPTRWIWLGALAGSVALPLVAAFPGGGTQTVTLPPIMATVAAGVSETVLPPTAPGWTAVDALILGGWGLASATLVVVLGAAWRRLRREIRAGETVALDGVAVRVTEHLGPAVVGFVHPRIVVPRWVLTLPDAARTLVVRHEEAHCAARDQRVLGAGLTVLVLVPWHPLILWQFLRLREAIELDCDQRLLRVGAPRQAYGALLLDLARRRPARPAALLALATSVSSLTRRITMLTRTRARTWPLRAFPATVAAAALVALACETPTPAADADRSAEAVAPSPSATDPVRVSGPPLRYPPLLRNAGIEGEVVVEFTVQTDGTVDPASVRVVESTHRGFEQQAADVLRRSLFRPATAGGEPVAATARQAVRFRIGTAGTSAPAPSDGITVTAEPSPREEP